MLLSLFAIRLHCCHYEFNLNRTFHVQTPSPLSLHSWSAQDFQKNINSWTVPYWLASLGLLYLQVGYSLEGYKAGELSFLFDMPPKGFVTLTPSFWSWTLWKLAVHMHDDVPVLEKVSYQICFLTSKHFAHFFLLRTSTPKAMGLIHKNLTKIKRCILHQKLRVRAILTMRRKTGCPTNQWRHWPAHHSSIWYCCCRPPTK